MYEIHKHKTKPVDNNLNFHDEGLHPLALKQPSPDPHALDRPLLHGVYGLSEQALVVVVEVVKDGPRLPPQLPEGLWHGPVQFLLNSGHYTCTHVHMYTCTHYTLHITHYTLHM